MVDVLEGGEVDVIVEVKVADEVEEVEGAEGVVMLAEEDEVCELVEGEDDGTVTELVEVTSDVEVETSCGAENAK